MMTRLRPMRVDVLGDELPSRELCPEYGHVDTSSQRCSVRRGVLALDVSRVVDDDRNVSIVRAHGDVVAGDRRDLAYGGLSMVKALVVRPGCSAGERHDHDE